MLLQEFVFIFFASKRLSLLTAFVCWKPETLVEFEAAAARAGVRVRLVTDWSPPALPSPLLPPDGEPREGVLLDTACACADLVLAEASSSRSFNLRFSWLILHVTNTNSSSGKAMETVLSEAGIFPDADVTWASADSLIDVYRTKQDQPLLFTEWNVGLNVSVEELQNFWSQQPSTVARRRDLRDVRLKCELIVSQPQHFKGWSDLNDRQIDTYPKVTYPLLMLLAGDLNFRYNIRQVDLYGEDRNGSFNGLAGSLQRGEVEIGGASMFMRADRWRILHYVAETVELKGSFMFRQPVQAAVTNVFVLPFSRGVWAASALLTAGAALMLALLARITSPMDPEMSKISPAECFTFAIATICQQGFFTTPSMLSARFTMFSLLMLALFTFTSYSAKIVSILQSPSNALRTIDDLVHSSIGVGVQETTYKKVYFAESTDPATMRLYRKKLLPLGDRAYMSVVDGVARMRREFFAFQVEESSGYEIISKTFTETEKCGLMQIKAFTLPMVAVPIRKHSGYRELLAVRLRWQREVGLMDRARRMWMERRPRCAGGGGFTSVSVEDVLPTIQVLGVGSLMSLLLLCAERAAHTVKMRKIWDERVQVGPPVPH